MLSKPLVGFEIFPVVLSKVMAKVKVFPSTTGKVLHSWWISEEQQMSST